MRPLLFLALLAACSLTIPISGAHAESYKGRLIGVIIEKSCQVSNHCVKYKDIIKYDTSNEKYSGNFISFKDDIRRVDSPYQNNIKWYEHDKNTHVLIDPPSGQRDKIQTITIVSNLDEFHLRGQFAITNQKIDDKLKDSGEIASIRSYSHTRYVDSTCTHAKIQAKNIDVLLPDTIDYLLSDCDPNHTAVKTISFVVKPLTKHDIGTSGKAKLDNFYDYVKKNCLQSRNACQMVDNRQTNTMGDAR